MSKFKVGDRVQVKADAECRLAGKTGRLEEKSSTSVYDFEFKPDDGGVGHSVNADELEPVTRKGAPANGQSLPGGSEVTAKPLPSVKVGDTVRVVLEGKVEYVDPDGEFDIRSKDANNYILPDGGLVKSIEILEPAKPSVKNLPVGSVVISEHGAVYKKYSSYWLTMGTDGTRSDTQVDSLSWTLLVPKESE